MSALLEATSAGLTWVEARDLTVGVAAVLTALAGIWRLAVRPVVAFFRRLEKVMTNVEAQLYPNGGKTLRDAVVRIEKRLGIEAPEEGS